MRSTLDTLTNIAVDWGKRCFGNTHMTDRGIRALRFAEEAIELAQACDVPQEQIAKLVGIVYSRPRGQYFQEIGGSMVTLAVLCDLLGIGIEEAFEAEVRRCLSKTPEHFATRNKEKLDLGLTAVPHA